MSSFVRRVQKGIAKAQGFYRSTLDITHKGDDGVETIETIKVIRNSDKEVVGRHWPQVSAPTKKKD